MAPLVGMSNPARHLTSVDFPDPERPTRATVVPGGTSSEISLRIGLSFAAE